MEPPRPLVPRRPGADHPVGPLTLALAAAAGAVAALSVGDAFAVAAILTVLARRPAPTAVAFLVAGALLVRWGSSSLGAIAGAQAVFGPAVLVGSGAEAASAGLAGMALLAVVPSAGRTGREGLAAAAPFGVLAAAVAAGPSYAGDPVVRSATTLAGVLAAMAIARWGPARWRHLPAVALAAAAVGLAAVG